MENTNTILAQNIKKYRTQCGITQDELAAKLGVTYQAVSKWENAKAAPDISFLPDMAEIFGCSIDELFGKEVHSEIHYDHCAEFPWADDNTLRGIVCLGRKILQVSDGITDKITFEIMLKEGELCSVQSECNITVNGDVKGNCCADGDIGVSGDIAGDCRADGDLAVGGNVIGGCNAGDDLTVGGDLKGDAKCGDSMTVNGSVEAKYIHCGDTFTVEGDVTCNELKCDTIEGEVTVLKK